MLTKGICWRLIKEEYRELCFCIKNADTEQQYTINRLYMSRDRLAHWLSEYNRLGGKRSIQHIVDTLTNCPLLYKTEN